MPPSAGAAAPSPSPSGPRAARRAPENGQPRFHEDTKGTQGPRHFTVRPMASLPCLSLAFLCFFGKLGLRFSVALKCTPSKGVSHSPALRSAHCPQGAPASPESPVVRPIALPSGAHQRPFPKAWRAKPAMPYRLPRAGRVPCAHARPAPACSLARRRRAGGAGRTSPCRGVGQRPTPSNPPIPFVLFVPSLCPLW